MRKLGAAVPVIGCLLFTGAHKQLPLFSGNQDTYFLWGLARAGYGQLSSDWLANQTDPVPAFSTLVCLVESVGARWAFYALHGLLVAAYALSLFLIVRLLLSKRSSVVPLAAASALLIHIHEPWLWNGWVQRLPGVLSRALTMPDRLSSTLTSGVAGQDVPGVVLLPSAFGVLLLVSLVLFISRRELAAVAVAALAAAIHPTYLLQAAILAAGFVTALLVERRRMRAVRVSVLAFLLLASLGALTLMRLGSSGADARATAEWVLYTVRIPHHADITAWAGADDLWRLLLVSAAVLVAWRYRRLRSVMLTSAVLAASLTAVQFWTGSKALALMFPWRASVWLVPTATAVLLGRGLHSLSAIVRAKLSERRRGTCSRALLVGAAAFALAACVLGILGTVHAAQGGASRHAVCDFVRAKGDPAGTYLIPLGLQGFRLDAGVGVFADSKSHPYRADEIVEWFDRTKLAFEFYYAGSPEAGAVALYRIHREEPISYVVVDADKQGRLDTTTLRLVYEDADYAIFATPYAGVE